VAPPENQAANGENKLQPKAMEGLGLLDQMLRLDCYENINNTITILEFPGI